MNGRLTTNREVCDEGREMINSGRCSPSDEMVYISKDDSTLYIMRLEVS